MKTFKRIAIKIGSNVLSRKDGTLDITRMSALVDQIAELKKNGIAVVLITSGAVASGRSEIKNHPKLDSVSQRQMFSAIGQAKLINRYYEFFRDHNILCGQVLTMKENFATRLHYLNQKNCMEVLLENGVIPIVNENDTVSVTELMFTDNDELSGLIATMLGMDALFILSNIDGVYDANPELPEAKLLKSIKPNSTLKTKSFISKQKSSLGRGGMATKFNVARKVAAEGIPVIIANGKRENILTDIILSDKEIPYTIFEPSNTHTSSLKKWLAHSEDFAKGEIHINQGAYEALISEQATSLLPVGITKVIGNFEKDDIVKVINPEGQAFAVGKVACDSVKAAETIGTKGEKPIIHYDYLCLE